MSKHTPGPWTVFAKQDVYVMAGNTLVADVSSGRMDHEPDLANAHLIAAAPELLAALAQIARLSETADRQRLDVASMLGDIARAVLAKVEG